MIILASKSPRRAKLLKDAGIDFIVIPSEAEEQVDFSLEPKEIVMQLAKLKAKEVSDRFNTDTVIGADTIVVFNNQILGKPKDEEDAFKTLSMLSDQCHEVYTGVSIIKGVLEETFVSQAQVCMKKLTELEIRAYIKTKEPMDKAGSYGIQGEGGNLVETYKGDFFTIMGLPLKEVVKQLDKFK